MSVSDSEVFANRVHEALLLPCFRSCHICHSGLGGYRIIQFFSDDAS